jgi:hypothetical protein
VRWEDGSENLVYCDELVTVDGASVAEGSSINYFWKPEKKSTLDVLSSYFKNWIKSLQFNQIPIQTCRRKKPT